MLSRRQFFVVALLLYSWGLNKWYGWGSSSAPTQAEGAGASAPGQDAGKEDRGDEELEPVPLFCSGSLFNVLSRHALISLLI